jgi:hypothetical protein
LLCLSAAVRRDTIRRCFAAPIREPKFASLRSDRHVRLHENPFCRCTRIAVQLCKSLHERVCRMLRSNRLAIKVT